MLHFCFFAYSMTTVSNYKTRIEQAHLLTWCVLVAKPVVMRKILSFVALKELLLEASARSMVPHWWAA